MKKLYKIADIALIFMLIKVLLCTDFACASMLRPALQTNSLFAETKDFLQREGKLWPELKSAIDKFKKIISGDLSENESIKQYYDRGNGKPDLVSIKFPVVPIMISPKFGETAPLEVNVEIQRYFEYSFSQSECIVVYKNSDSQKLIEMDSFMTDGFDPCFVAYFFAFNPKDTAKKILVAFHLPVMKRTDTNENNDFHYQLFLFIKTLISSYGIGSDNMIVSFYGNRGIADKEKNEIKEDFYNLFPKANLYDEKWGTKVNNVAAKVTGDKLELTYKYGLLLDGRSKIVLSYNENLIKALPLEQKLPEKDYEKEKRLASIEAAKIVRDMVEEKGSTSEHPFVLGIGGGTNIWDHAIDEVSRLGLGDRIVAISASDKTTQIAKEKGLVVMPYKLARNFTIDLAIDGADEVSPEGYCIKGGGGCLTRELEVIKKAKRVIIVAESKKLVEKLGKFRLPIDIEEAYKNSVIEALKALGCGEISTKTNEDGSLFRPDGGDGRLIINADFSGKLAKPAEIASAIKKIKGVVTQGIFFSDKPPSLVLIGDNDTVKHIEPGRPVNAVSRRQEVKIISFLKPIPGMSSQVTIVNASIDGQLYEISKIGVKEIMSGFSGGSNAITDLKKIIEIVELVNKADSGLGEAALKEDWYWWAPGLSIGEIKDRRKKILWVEEALINRMEKAWLESIVDSIKEATPDLVKNNNFRNESGNNLIRDLALGNSMLPQLFILTIGKYSISDGMGLKTLNESIDFLEKYKEYIGIFIEHENPFSVYQVSELEKMASHRFIFKDPAQDFQEYIEKPGAKKDLDSLLRPYMETINKNLSELKLIRDKAKELTFKGIPLLKLSFPKYIKKDIPVKMLDVGSGYNQLFLYRLKKVMEENNIKADISGVEPKATKEDIDMAKSSGMTLMPGYLEYLKGDASQKQKYHIIFINAPDFIKDTEEFLKTLDYILSEDGLVIFRSGEGERYRYESGLKKTLDKKYSDKWKTERIEIEMKDLPEGDFPLAAPLLIRRAARGMPLELIRKMPSRDQI